MVQWFDKGQYTDLVNMCDWVVNGGLRYWATTLEGEIARSNPF